MNRIKYEAECYDELNGVDKNIHKWLNGCTFESDCECLYCRGDEGYWNEVWVGDLMEGNYAS